MLPRKPPTPLVRPQGPEFKKILADIIARAQTLSAGARSRLAGEWLDEENELHRFEVIGAAGAAGAPREWSTVARIVSSTLADWPAAARGAVVDAAFALTAIGVPEDAEALLVPWRSALRPGRTDTSPVPSETSEDELCPHGKAMGTCPFVACTGHSLGGMPFDQN